MATSHCEEISGEIIKLEAYPQASLSIAPGYTQKRYIHASSIGGLTSAHLIISIREQTGAFKSSGSEDAGGPLWENSINWQSDSVETDIFEQMHRLETENFHYIVTVYGGARYLINNEDARGRTHAELQTTDETTLSANYSIISRSPALLIIQ